MSHALRATAVESLLPVGGVAERGLCAEGPDGIVAEELAAGSRQYRLVGLGSDAALGRVVLIFVRTLHQNERLAIRTGESLRSLFPDRLVSINISKRDPGFIRPIRQDIRFRAAVNRLERLLVHLSNSSDDRFHQKLVRRVEIAAMDPDDITQVLVARSHRSSVRM